MYAVFQLNEKSNSQDKMNHIQNRELLVRMQKTLLE